MRLSLLKVRDSWVLFLTAVIIFAGAASAAAQRIRQPSKSRFHVGQKVEFDWMGNIRSGEVVGIEPTGWVRVRFENNGDVRVWPLPPDDVWLPRKTAETSKAGQANTPLRTWTDSTGQFKLEARFVSLQDGDVTLEKTDSTRKTLPLEKLSEEDQVTAKKFAEKAQKDSADKGISEHTFADVRGNKLTARFVRLDGLSVILSKDGRERAYPLNGFSHDDRRYIVEADVERRKSELAGGGETPGMRTPTPRSPQMPSMPSSQDGISSIPEGDQDRIASAERLEQEALQRHKEERAKVMAARDAERQRRREAMQSANQPTSAAPETPGTPVAQPAISVPAPIPNFRPTTEPESGMMGLYIGVAIFVGLILALIVAVIVKIERSTPAGAKTRDLSAVEAVVCMLFPLIGLIAGLLWMLQGYKKGKKATAIGGVVFAVSLVIAIIRLSGK